MTEEENYQELLATLEWAASVALDMEEKIPEDELEQSYVTVSGVRLLEAIEELFNFAEAAYGIDIDKLFEMVEIERQLSINMVQDDNTH